MPLPPIDEMRLVGAHLACCVVVDEALSVTVHTPPVAAIAAVLAAKGAVKVVVIETGPVANNALPACCVTYSVGVSAVTVSVMACSEMVVVTSTYVVTCLKQSTSKAFWSVRALWPRRWTTGMTGESAGDLWSSGLAVRLATVPL